MTDEHLNGQQNSGAKAEQSLTARTFRGFLWAFSGAGVQSVLKIVVLTVLARLVDPGSFGVVSAAMTVVALAELFGQVGVAPAIVQAPELTDRIVRTGSTVTIMSGFVAGAGLFLLAPQVAVLFQMAAVEPVIRAFSLVFVVTSFSIVPMALMQRRMQFRGIALVTLASYLFGYAAVSIGLAVLGFGIWALVWGQVAQSCLAGVGFFMASGHSVRPLIDKTAFKHLFRFGAGMTLSRFGNYIALNVDYFVVGRWLGAEALGFYSRAYILLVQPANLVGSVGEKVLYPALASVQNDSARFVRGYYRAIGLVAMTNVPGSAVLVVLAPELINLLLGPQWRPAVLPFQILVLALGFRTGYKLTSTLLRARGSVYLAAMWQWTYAALVAASAFVGLRWGVVGVAAGVSVAIGASFWIGAAIGKLAAPISLLTMLTIYARHSVVALLILVPLGVVRHVVVRAGLPDIAIVAGCSAVAAAIYLAVWAVAGRLFGDEGAWARSMVEPHLRRILRRPGGKSAPPI